MAREDADTAELVEPHGSLPETPLISSSLVEVDVSGLSHLGYVRPNNQDHFYIGCATRNLQTLKTSVPATEIPDRFGEIAYGMIVADGIGGQAGGEVASQMAIGTMIHLVLSTTDWIMRSEQLDTERLIERMSERFRKVNEAVLQRSKREPSLAGMGTTMTMACSVGRRLLIGHLGDSRAYLYRDGVLKQLTHDHTLAQKLADAGLISSSELDSHGARHILTEAIGAGQRSEAQVHLVDLEDGDDVLLCTDGLTGMAADNAIADILHQRKPSEEICQLLVDAALAGGGRDNVTVVLAQYRIPEQV